MTPRPSLERGGVVWLDVTPGAGHEQAGRRPPVVLSPALCNRPFGLCEAWAGGA